MTNPRTTPNIGAAVHEAAEFSRISHPLPFSFQLVEYFARRIPQTTMSESLRYLGSLQGHKGWITAIATSSENPDMILTASRGRFLGSFCLASLYIDNPSR